MTGVVRPYQEQFRPEPDCTQCTPLWVGYFKWALLTLGFQDGRHINARNFQLEAEYSSDLRMLHSPPARKRVSMT